MSFNRYQVPHTQNKILGSSIMARRKHFGIHAVIDHICVRSHFTNYATSNFSAYADGFCGGPVDSAGDLFTPPSPKAAYLIGKENIQTMDCHNKGDAQFLCKMSGSMPARKRRMRVDKIERFPGMEEAYLTQNSRKQKISCTRQAQSSRQCKKTMATGGRCRFGGFDFFWVTGLYTEHSVLYASAF